MSHGMTSGPATRKERRAARGGTRQAAPRYFFSAAAHIRKDWIPEDVTEMLESRARGYNGILRQLLCTAAAMLRDAVSEDLLTKVPAKAVAISKRNHQPGRLSGGEREALKKFAAHIAAAGHNGTLIDEAMVEGRAMLANVRRRALSDGATSVMNEITKEDGS